MTATLQGSSGSGHISAPKKSEELLKCLGGRATKARGALKGQSLSGCCSKLFPPLLDVNFPDGKSLWQDIAAEAAQSGRPFAVLIHIKSAGALLALLSPLVVSDGDVSMAGGS